MARLITNQKEFLSEIIEKILPSSSRLHILVGYFYFSGFRQICEHIKDKNIRILVGMNIEKSFLNRIKEYSITPNVSQSHLEIKQDYFKSLVAIINDTDYFDSEEKQEAFRIYLNKIKDGSLEIRKTKDPNHAKLYLFESKPEHSMDGLFPGKMITGSSNLTFSGLTGRHELNVLLEDEYFEGKKIFDDLWDNDSVEIVAPDSIDDFIEEVVDKIWIDKLFKPYLFYIRVLSEYFKLHTREEITYPYEITQGEYLDLKYQKDAIQKSLDVLDRHNGVLVCDVVGLGKSIIASAIAYNLRKKVIIIAPPQLKYQWDNIYRTQFSFNAVVFGSGSIDKALEQQKVWQAEELLIIVDEAHKYRNENTINYLNLHRLCQGNKVVLLTATPFNNHPKDIFSMLKLFQIPTRSTIRTVDNLSARFQQLIKRHGVIEKERKKTDPKDRIGQNRIRKKLQELAKNIRAIIEPVVIRRSRIDLEKITEYRQDLERQNLSYSTVKPPIRKEYHLGDLSDLYLQTLLSIEGSTVAPENKENQHLIGARYNPVSYIIDMDSFLDRLEREYPNVDRGALQIAQINLANLMKRLLVARFESSLFAFQKTLNSMIDSMKNMKDYYKRLGRVPVFKKHSMPKVDILIEDLDEEAMANLEEYSFEVELESEFERDLFFIRRDELSNEYLTDLENDIALLEEIQRDWFGSGFPQDPKLESLIKDIREQLKKEPERKIIVFSEYSDTVSYLYKEIRKDSFFKVIHHHSAMGAKNLNTIRQNFDASDTNQKNDFNLLIATDALSEGVNLNRAGTVFNYDIPYNPTRVIQRVGRINRIGKKLFDELFIYNYFPTDIGEGEIRRKQISTLKKTMIDALLGEDTKVLTTEEELNSYFNEKFHDAMVQDEEESWDTKYQEDLYYTKINHPEHIEYANQIPHRSRICRKIKDSEAGVLIFGKKADEFTFQFGLSEDESKFISPEEALALFKADQIEKPFRVSPSFEAIYQNAKKSLFSVKTKVEIDAALGKTLRNIEFLKDNCSSKKDYLSDLYTVAKDLVALPEFAEKHIRSMTFGVRNLTASVEEIENLIPHEYLAKIITTARKVDSGEETLILAEEFTTN